MNARDILRQLFDAAIAAADPESCLPPHMLPDDGGRLIVIGAGKASAAMARAVEQHWSGPLDGLVVTRYGHGVPCERIEIVEAAHPVPDAAGEAAAARILAKLAGLRAQDRVLALISGGGSALLAAPAEGLSLADKRAITAALLKSGASIGEMNCVRKHLSAIKGGRLAAAAWPAPVLTLAISDVLRIRVVSIEGEVFEIGSEAPDTPGYDLLALLIGSEGMLGVVTEVTVKLVPKPELAQVVMASFNDVAKAGEAVAAIIAAGIIPAGLEMMDKPATAAVEPFVKAGYDLAAEAILLCESDGTPEEVAEEIARVTEVLTRAGASNISVSQSEAERLRFWAGRKAAFPAVGRITPDYYCMDGTIPRKRLAEMLSAIAGMEKKYGLRCANVFHAGDGNLHPLIMYDAAKPGEWERAEAFGAEILELSVALGGSITGEHGVGVEKINQMCVQYTTPELEAFHLVKAAFDEGGLLNPGKAVPSLHRCAEYGRMHVHRGDLKFPELERF